jgi:hypothetical protein
MYAQTCKAFNRRTTTTTKDEYPSSKLLLIKRRKLDVFEVISGFLC